MKIKLLGTSIKGKKLHFRKKTLKKRAKRLGWKGTGTLGDPIVIDSTGNYPTRLALTTGDIHIRVKNLLITKLLLYGCENIVIENCKISYLRIEGCKNIVVKNNSIVKITQFLSGAIHYDGNEILDESYKRLLNNYYDKTSTILISGLGILIGILSIIYFLTGLFYWRSIGASIYYLIVGSLSLGIVSYFFLKKLKVKKLNSSKFENFKIVTFDPLVRLFDTSYKELIQSRADG